ncbi:hypothetical protein K4K58_006856 [Colletotrichum sp. SAR11_239]|nr:hypothetical protein K4K58_006856 [Colletotrichum sp. SAR11_239]
MESSHDAAAPSSPIQVFLELDDPDDIDDLLLDQLNPLSNLGHDDDHTRSFSEYSLANDLPMPDDPVPDPKTLDKTNPAAQTLECKKEEEPEPDSPFGTPEPQPITPWNEHDTRTLGRFLQSAYGPLPVAAIAEHMGRDVIDTTAMLVCVWLSAVRVSEERSAQIPWWAGRPVFNSTGFGRASVFTREEGRVMLQFYDAQGQLDAEAPIESPSQVYDQDMV